MDSAQTLVLSEVQKHTALGGITKEQVLTNLGWYVNGGRFAVVVAFDALERAGRIRQTDRLSAEGRPLWEATE